MFSMDCELAYFLSIPWCSKQLSGSDIETQVRRSQASGEDELWFKTLKTPETLPAFVAFYRKPPHAHQRVEEVKAFVTVARGVQGFPGLVHGGIIATLLDGIAGLIPGVNRQRGVFPAVPFVTAYLNTTYSGPVPTPGTILLGAKIVKHAGRKLFVEAYIQDEGGRILAKGDVLFIETKSSL